jgi:8-hydroxy-5-deazaflavin:NADPH oxidoreductase
MDISVIGGTGDEGFGLTLRLATAGHHVTIGSRTAEKGSAVADTAREMLGRDANVDGASNEEAATADVVFVTVPFAGQAEIYRSIKDHVMRHAVVVDCTSPLATAVGGRAWQVVRPWHGSAAEQAKAILEQVHPVRLVGAFHTISGASLQDLEHDMETDVLVCGTDTDAKALVGGLIEQIPRLRWVDVGDLTQARIVEPLTALMISVNRTYKIHDAGVRITGRDAWGVPGPAT